MRMGPVGVPTSTESSRRSMLGRAYHRRNAIVAGVRPGARSVAPPFHREGALDGRAGRRFAARIKELDLERILPVVGRGDGPGAPFRRVSLGPLFRQTRALQGHAYGVLLLTERGIENV